MSRCSILTYHSQNVHGHSCAENDHTALRQDLESLHEAGVSIVSLRRVADWLDGEPLKEAARGAADVQ